MTCIWFSLNPFSLYFFSIIARDIVQRPQELFDNAQRCFFQASHERIYGQALMSVSDSFAKLIDRIQPTQVAIQNAVQHAKQIKTRLEQSYNLRKLFFVGSFPRQTYVRSSSDIDFF